MLAYDQEEATLPTLEQRELKFYKERVVPYSLEFTNYGRGTMLDRTNILQQGMGVKTTNRYYFHKNQLGSIIGLSNGSGDIVIEYGYDDYGKLFVKTGNGEYISIENYEGNDYSNVRLYTSREYDKELGRYYYRARMYAPEIGRFTSIDPIGPKDDINMFTYVGNNPINRIDPMGLEKCIVPKNPPQSAQEHYLRNILNIDLPNNENDAKDQNWIKLSNVKSVYHSYGIGLFKFNNKYISPDGHREAVYDPKSGKLITDPVNMGTYNYYNPLTDVQNHYWYDIDPYFSYGNEANDTTSVLSRKIQTASYLEALVIDFKDISVDKLDDKVEEINNTINQVEYNINNKIQDFNQQKFVNDFIQYINYR